MATPARDPSGVPAAKPAARPRSRRLEELDGLRTLMVLVVVFHAYQASKGDLSPHAFRDFSVPGVLVGNIDVLLPVFFLLTGFGLYYGLAGAVMRGRPLPSGREFLVRRGLRILPVYLVVFLVVWVWRYGGGTGQWLDLVWGLTLMQSWSTEHIFRTIDPGWYLSVEWQFSVVTAAVILPWMRRVATWPPRSRLVGLLVPPAVLVAITLWWKQGLISHGVGGNRLGAWFAPPSWALLYGAGMLLGLALVLRAPDRWRLPRPVPAALFVVGTAWIVWLASVRSDSVGVAQWTFELSLFGPLLWMVAALSADPDGRVRRALRSGPVQLIAAASFSTYLVHAPVLRSLNARDILPMDVPAMWPVSVLAMIVVAMPLGILAYRYIEQPLAGLDRLLRPKVERDSRVTGVAAPTLEPGTPLPAAVLRDGARRPRPLRELTGPGGLLLLVHPADPVPRGDRRLHGGRGALRALDSSQAAASGYGIRLAALSPRVPHETEQGAPPHPADEPQDDALVHLEDADAAVAAHLGLRVVKTAGGRRQPEVALVAVDAGGTVVAVVRDEDPHRLVRTGLDRLTGEGPAPGVAPRPALA